VQVNGHLIQLQGRFKRKNLAAVPSYNVAGLEEFPAYAIIQQLVAFPDVRQAKIPIPVVLSLS
jgi:hypothetical protein